MQMKFLPSFLILYEERNFSKASARLYITQQGLSRQIQAFESSLDVTLFVRSRHGVVPTPICEALYPVFRHMQDEYEKAVALIEDSKKQGGKCISVAFAQGISNGGSAEFIFDYQKLHPEMHIEITESTQPVCIQRLLDREIDIAFLVSPIDTAMFNTLTLSEGYMYAAMHKTHPLASGTEPLDFSLMDGENIITGSHQNALRGIFDHFCRLTNIHPHIIVSSNYSLTYVNAMVDNIGIATVTATMARQITNPDIRFRRLLTPEPAYVYCCTPYIKPEKEISALLGYIKRHFELEPLPRLENCP